MSYLCISNIRYYGRSSGQSEVACGILYDELKEPKNIVNKEKDEVCLLMANRAKARCQW